MKKRLVVLTGAGVSAESGIKTFRDSNGLWENHNIEDVAYIGGWRKNKQLVLDFYNLRRKDAAKAVPNAAHFGLADLENDFDVVIVTQNVDDLHERAGSTNIMHLHGELSKKRSSLDPELIYEWPADEDIQIGDKCEKGSQIRPHIVWFGEGVPMISEAAKIAAEADIFVVIGTSLQVYPASDLLFYVQDDAPKFIIDPAIPLITKVQNLTRIEKSATDGIRELKDKLKELI